MKVTELSLTRLRPFLLSRINMPIRSPPKRRATRTRVFRSWPMHCGNSEGV